MKYRIFTANKKNIFDPEAGKLSAELEHLGIGYSGGIRVFSVCELSGELSKGQVETICDNLLADPLTQDYFTGAPPEKTGSFIEVYFKPGVTDSVSDTILLGIKDMGIKKELSARTGKMVWFSKKTERQKLEKIASGILANSIIQEYRIFTR